MKNIISLFIILFLSFNIYGCSNEKEIDNTYGRYDTTILAFGDSLTYGYNLDEKLSYPARFQEISRYQTINAGLNGDMAKRALKRMDFEINRYKPNIVFLSIGGNDMLRNKDENLEKDLVEIIEFIKSKDILPILISQPKPSFFKLKDAEVYKSVANTTGVILIEGLWSDLLNRDEYKLDKIHLNAQGYKIFSERLYIELVNKGLLKDEGI